MGLTVDDGGNMCPLCMEEMDLTDRQLRPCQCGYEICVWCWHQIMELAAKEDTKGRCPACRICYDKEKIVGAASDCERLIDLATKKKRPQKVKSKVEVRKHLSNARVVQRNLVYVVGFPLDLAAEENLEKREYFGQYGRILKISVSHTNSYSGQNAHTSPSASVYITYTREEDALHCIRAVDGCIVEGKLLRACFGTNKYCNAWLKNTPCYNPDCLYLHEEGAEEDSFMKEEMLVNKHQHFQQLTHPPHRAIGTGLPPPFSEASTTLCNSVSGSQHIHVQTAGVLGKLPASSTGSGKTTNLPAAASWGMRGKSAIVKTTMNGCRVKKTSPVLMSPPSCSLALSDRPMIGTLPSAACDVVPRRVMSAVVHNNSVRYNFKGQLMSTQQSASSSGSPPSTQLNLGDVSISMRSSFPIDLSAVQDDILVREDTSDHSSFELERTQTEIFRETDTISFSTLGKEVSEDAVLQASTSKPFVGKSRLSVAEDKIFTKAVARNAGNKDPSLHIGDDGIISEILTMNFDNDDLFASPLHLAKLLKAGPSNLLVHQSCKDLAVRWKPQSSSQSRFSFARGEDDEKANGGIYLCSSSGDYANQQSCTAQTHSLAKQIGRKINLNALESSGIDAELGLQKEIPAGFSLRTSLGSNESLDLRNQTSLHTSETTGFSAPVMVSLKERLYAPPGFPPMKVSSIYPPRFNSNNTLGWIVFDGLNANQSLGRGISSGLFMSPLSAPHVTDKNVNDGEVIDPVIMAVGRGKLPLHVGEIGSFDVSPISPLEVGQSISSIQESSQVHDLFTRGTSSMNSDMLGYGPRLAEPHHSGTPDMESLIKHQQQRSGFINDSFELMPYLVERQFSNHGIHALSSLSSATFHGGLPTSLLNEGSYMQPIAPNSAFCIVPGTHLNLTHSSSLDQIGVETSEWDDDGQGQRLYSNLRSRPVLERLDPRPDAASGSLSLETEIKNIALSSSKNDSSRINIDRYSFGQPLGSLSRLDFICKFKIMLLLIFKPLWSGKVTVMVKPAIVHVQSNSGCYLDSLIHFRILFAGYSVI